MIKVSTRHNLIYVIILIASFTIRKIVLIIIHSLFGFSNSLLYTLLMFLSELCSGSLIYQYQKNALPEDNKINIQIVNLKRSIVKSRTNNNKNCLKIYSLLIMVGFFDFIEFSISALYIPKFKSFSQTLEIRLCGLLIIIGSIIYYFSLKLPIFRHQLFCLILIGICIIILIITEIIFQKDYIATFNNDINFVSLLFLVILELFFLAVLHSADKYLMEYHSVKPCIILIVEGLSGLVFSFIALVEDNPLIKLQKVYDESSVGSFILFIFLIFIFFILSGLTNIYRLETNKLYSPMAETLSNYFSNPIFIIYVYISGDDFIIKGEKNISYFIINLILSFIITLTGLVFNEFVVLFCCGLEYNTYKQITQRAKDMEVNYNELNDVTGDENNTDNDNKDETYVIYV